MYRFSWWVAGTEVDWWVADLDNDEDAAREAQRLEEETVGGGWRRLPEGGTVKWALADQRTIELVRKQILALEGERDLLDRLDPDRNTEYAVYEGHAVPIGDRDRGLCRAESYGQAWFVVEAKSPEEAVEQARLYERGEHGEQRRMEAFAKAIRQGVLPSLDELEDAEPGETDRRLSERHTAFAMTWDFRKAIREGDIESRSTVEDVLDAGPFTEEERADLRALMDEYMPG